MKQVRFFLATLLLLFTSVNTRADVEHSLWTKVTSEECSKNVAFTYNGTSKTLDVVLSYTLEAAQEVNRNYDHAILSIPYTELSEVMGVTVSASNVYNMLYFPLNDSGNYGLNTENWYDKNGFRSSWGSQSWWFIQPVTTDASNLIIWTGQAGNYNSQYGSSIGDSYSSTFYLVGDGTTAVEFILTLEVTTKVTKPEWVHVVTGEGFANARDLGGWTTERGETVQYGKLFRGSELQGDRYTATATDIALLHSTLGVRAELDLRQHGEAKGITASVIGSDVEYLRIVNEPYYLDGARTGFANYRHDFDYILKHLRNGEPVYFHCIWGADRTGTLAFLLEGLMGLSEENLYQEYELTQLSTIDGNLRPRSILEPLMRYIRTFDGETLQQQFINYWHLNARVSLEDLNTFCQLMLGTTTDYIAAVPEGLDNLAFDVSRQEASFTHATTDLYSVNDGLLGFDELPENKHWNTWDATRTAEHWLRYEWSEAQTVERVRVAFWSDSETPGDHVLIPASWKVQYYDEATNAWTDVALLDGEAYTQSRTAVSSVRFTPVTTKQLQLVMQAQKGSTTYSAVGVTEWEALGHRPAAVTEYGDYPIHNVDFSKVKLSDSFWQPRIVQNQQVTIPIALQHCEDNHRMLNFEKAAAILRGENIGYFDTEYPFDDTDIYKILEGMAYSVQTMPNAEMSAKMDELIDLIGSAQEPDGYLYTARTAGQPGNYHAWVGQNRWETDPDLSHELYNSGHLYEAAYAHYIATGKSTLLDIATKNADLLVREFLEGGLTFVPGHEIVEMGLVKLFRLTGKDDYMRLAKYFLDLRGRQGSTRNDYSQTTKPVVMQDEAVGHAVRATYLYSGMADVAAIMGNTDYLNAIDRIWENVVGKKFYVTGGIGARHAGEAFGDNYELPNKEAYCETCGAIANVYWNWRMFLLHGESKYYDVLERTLYNGAISGVNLAGNKFFYPNPLASDGTGYNGRSAEREPWFGCSCCPSQICRFMASVPGYIYAHKDNKVYVNLYMQGVADIDMGETYGTLKLTQTTDYPWNGDISVTIGADRLTNKNLTLMLRLPGWAKGQPVPSDLYTYVNATSSDIVVSVNGTPVDYTMQDGYMTIQREWAEGDVVTFSLPMPARHVVAHANVAADAGLVAVERGPIVYCMEWPDNPTGFTSLIADDEAEATESQATIENSNFTALALAGQSKAGSTTKPATINLIPYYAWANRGKGYMQVWMPRTADKAYSENYPLNVGLNDIEIVADNTINITTSVLNDGWATHTVSGLDAGGNLLNQLGITTSQLTLDMMYAPLDGTTLNRTKNASNIGFWFQMTENSGEESGDGPVALYNQTSWSEMPARIFLHVEGFYNPSNNTIAIGHGQRPNACKKTVYTLPVYMLAPTDENGSHKAVRFTFRFDLRDPAIILDENSAYTETATTSDVRLTREIHEGFNTIVLPFAMTSELMTEVFGAGTLYRYTDADHGVLNFETAEALEPHVPYLFKAEAAKSLQEKTIAARTLTISDNNLTAAGTDYNFVGSYVPFAKDADDNPLVPNSDYVLGNDNSFHLTTIKNAVKSFRAYITPNEPTSNVKSLSIALDGIETAIGLTPGHSPSEVGSIYSLSGQRLAKPVRGVNIINGRKVIVK